MSFPPPLQTQLAVLPSELLQTPDNAEVEEVAVPAGSTHAADVTHDDATIYKTAARVSISPQQHQQPTSTEQIKSRPPPPPPRSAPPPSPLPTTGGAPGAPSGQISAAIVVGVALLMLLLFHCWQARATLVHLVGVRQGSAAQRQASYSRVAALENLPEEGEDIDAWGLDEVVVDTNVRNTM